MENKSYSSTTVADPVGLIATQTPLPKPTATATPTSLPIFTITPTNTVEGLYYYNDFSGQTTGLEDWILYEVPFTRHWNGHPDNFPDVQNQSDKKQIMDAFDMDPVYAIYDGRLWNSDLRLDEAFEFSGSGDASHSLICRYSDSGWYEAGISSYGTWKISLSRVVASKLERTTLIEGTSAPITSGIINMSVICHGDTIGLKINGQDLGVVTDNRLPEGDLVGFVYEENPPSEIQVKINKLDVFDENESRLIEWSTGQNSFYFNKPYFVVSTKYPQEVRSLMKGYTKIEVADGQARLSESKPGWVLLINPLEMPRDVEVSMKVTSNSLDHDIGILCNWSPEKGGYLLWYRKPYTIITPFDLDEHGVPIYRGGKWEFMTTGYGKLLDNTTHQITAFCAVGMTKLYIDGQQVMSAPLANFKAPDNNKNGRMIGLAFGTNVTDDALIFIDNLMVSWRVPTPTPSGN